MQSTVKKKPAEWELDELESPFLQEQLFEREAEPAWEAHLPALEAESPFLHAFEPGETSVIEPSEAEEAFVEEEDRGRRGRFSG